MALDVGIDEWDWITTSTCDDKCFVTPCCRNKGEYVCSADDVKRAHASTVHLEWYGLKKERNCGRTCCQRWSELNLDTLSQTLIGVQNEKNSWGNNADPLVISSLDYFLTFQVSNSVTPFKNSKGTQVKQYQFAEPEWAFDSLLLKTPGGVSNDIQVSQWRSKAPGPSVPNAISFIQNVCKPDYNELKSRGLVFDSYGACDHNRDPGFPLAVWDTTMYNQKLALLSGYTFDLALENSFIDPWWNTERLYHGLLVGTIPIYGGHETVYQLIPHKDSIIYVNSFGGDFDKLADYIKNVSVDPQLKAKHLYWTTLQPDQWENGFPHRHRDNSRLSGSMCQVCQDLHSRYFGECER